VPEENHVLTLVLSRGPASRRGKLTYDSTRDIIAASRLLITAVAICDLPDQKFDTVPILDINRIIEGEIDRFRPEIAYTHSQHDVNKDHRIVFEATLVACRPVPGSSVKRLLSYEVP